jgi:uncharacterized membrane protein
VQTFDATFVQHCEGGTTAARGQIHISNPPAPHQAAPKPVTTTSKHATSTSTHATSRPSAHATSRPSATASSGTVAANDTDTPATPAVVNNAAARTPLLLIGVGVVAWGVLVVVGLVTGGVVMAVRRR